MTVKWKQSLLLLFIVGLFCSNVLALSLQSGHASVMISLEQNASIASLAHGVKAPTILKNAFSIKIKNYSQVQMSDIKSDQFIQTGKSFPLSDEERMAVECAVMGEAGAESLEGKMMIAECILDGAERNNLSIIETISKYGIYSSNQSSVTEEVCEAVSNVFDKGERVTAEKADLWYNPAVGPSPWHEAQQYIITIGNHRFFWMSSNAT